MRGVLQVAELLEKCGWGQDAFEEGLRSGMIKQRKPEDAEREARALEEEERKEKLKQKANRTLDQRARKNSFDFHGVKL